LPFAQNLTREGKLIFVSVSGGLASVAGGGKFGNGAVTAAFGYLFNACVHDKGCWTTSEEQALADKGDYLGYYDKACSGGDQYACAARGIAAGDGFAANLTSERLKTMLQTIAGYKPNEISGIMEQIRIDLARAYASYLPDQESFARWHTGRGIAEFHWDVFRNYRLPPMAFGGTPFGRNGPIMFMKTGPAWCTTCR
jgi:hypothetical protein